MGARDAASRPRRTEANGNTEGIIEILRDGLSRVSAGRICPVIHGAFAAEAARGGHYLCGLRLSSRTVYGNRTLIAVRGIQHRIADIRDVDVDVVTIQIFVAFNDPVPAVPRNGLNILVLPARIVVRV